MTFQKLTNKKIVFFLYDLGLGGTEQVVVKLSNYFISQNNSVHILCVNNKNEFLGKLNNKVQVFSLDKKKIILSLIQLIKFIHKENFDAFIANVWPLTSISIIAGLTKPSTLKKIFLVEHCNLSEEFKHKGKLFMLFQKISIMLFHNLSSKVISVSGGVQNDLIKKGVRKKICKIIFNPAFIEDSDLDFDLDPTCQKWSNDQRCKLISIGNFKENNQKNYPNLIEALNILKKEKRLDFHSLIVGEGPGREKIEKMIEARGLSEDISLAGLVKNPIGLLKKSDMLVLSSNFEGFGLVIVEALSVGVTVVSTDCLSGPSEIIKNNEFGYLCKVDDSNDLAKQIKFACSNKIDAEILKGRSKDFSIEKIGPIYKELLDFPS